MYILGFCRLFFFNVIYLFCISWNKYICWGVLFNLFCKYRRRGKWECNFILWVGFFKIFVDFLKYVGYWGSSKNGNILCEVRGWEKRECIYKVEFFEFYFGFFLRWVWE